MPAIVSWEPIVSNGPPVSEYFYNNGDARHRAVNLLNERISPHITFTVLLYGQETAYNDTLKSAKQDDIDAAYDIAVDNWLWYLSQHQPNVRLSTTPSTPPPDTNTGIK